MNETPLSRALSNKSVLSALSLRSLEGEVEDAGARQSSFFKQFTMYCFILNIILGCGVLGMPYAFYKAGLVFSVILLIVATILSYVTVRWIAETVARTQILMVAKSRMVSSSSTESEGSSQDRVWQTYNHVRPESLTITSLCRLYLGVSGQVVCK